MVQKETGEGEDGVSLAKKDWFVNGIRMIPTEDEEQKTVISWCRLNESRWPELRWIHHIPNGGKRSKAEAAGFQAMGVLAGVPDLFLPVKRVWHHGLYVEMKALDGKVSKEQREFLTAAAEQGFCCCVCFGADAAMDVIENYLRGERFPAELADGTRIEGVKVF